MDHSRAPVLEALQAFREQGYTPFNPPGHRQGRGVDPRVLDVVGADVFASDVISINGLDDRRVAQGVLARAQELMADAVHADHAFFSTCGSSLSVKSAMLAVAGPHEKLLVARQSHKSVISGLILSGVAPVWVRPNWDGDLHLSHPPGPDEVRAVFEEEPDAKGMLLVTPTDYGTCGDIAAVAAVCHELGKPLIVDEAWGAHLPFHPDLPPWAMDAGADLCVTSVHKSGSAIEQSSVFHLQGDRVDPAVLKAREDLLGTTSPTSLVYATLDGWRRQMVEHGKELLGAALALAHATRDALADLPGIRVMGAGVRRPGAAFPRPAQDRDRRVRPRHQRLPGHRLAARAPAGHPGPVRPPQDGRAADSADDEETAATLVGQSRPGDAPPACRLRTWTCRARPTWSWRRRCFPATRSSPRPNRSTRRSGWQDQRRDDHAVPAGRTRRPPR